MSIPFFGLSKDIAGIIETNLHILNTSSSLSFYHLELGVQVEGENFFRLQKDSFWGKIFHLFREKSFFVNEVHAEIKRQINWLSQNKEICLKGNRLTSLFYEARKFNQQLFHATAKKETSPNHAIEEIVALGGISYIEGEHLDPLVYQQFSKKPFFFERPRNLLPHKIRGRFYYDKNSTKIHVMDNIKIFLETQYERFLSSIGKIVEFICSLLSCNVQWFKKFHYFSNEEEQQISNEQPLLERAYSYWKGHSTCHLHLPFSLEDAEDIFINFCTDLVEDHLEYFFYPRQTKVVRKVEKSPIYHVYLLSHNHRDHLEEKAVKKLLQQQPYMIVPQGDGKLFEKMGFTRVIEVCWWDQVTLKFEKNGKIYEVPITAVPANHWSGRGMFDGNCSLFNGYVIHNKKIKDIYFPGDTARLNEHHVEAIRKNFDLSVIYQPGGPDQNMQSIRESHQTSAEGLLMYVRLFLQKVYDANLEKSRFIDLVSQKSFKMFYIHANTYKLGTSHFNDPEKSKNRVLQALRDKKDQGLERHEKKVLQELTEHCEKMQFLYGETLKSEELADMLEKGAMLPKLGSVTYFD